MRPLVLFHGGCNDGFCAAWVYRRYVNPQAEFRSVQYNFPPPPLAGRQVIILDFCYDRQTLVTLREQAASLLVLDHHQTAARDLTGLNFCIFDQSKSAARLTWEYFFDPQQQGSRESVPWLVAYTEDRDLWRWTLPHSKAVNAALSSYPRRFEVWDELARRRPEDLAQEGQAILRYQYQLIRPRLKNHGWTTIANVRVPIANATFLISEIGNALAVNQPFAAVFFVTPNNQVVYNLRSQGEKGLDVGEIARQYGGGGHRHAAAFTLNALLPMEGPSPAEEGNQEYLPPAERDK